MSGPSPSPSSAADTEVFKKMEDYAWDDDHEFQAGLSAILGQRPAPPTADPDEAAEPLVLRARCFYYARKYQIPIDYDAYVSWRRQQQQQGRERERGRELPPSVSAPAPTSASAAAAAPMTASAFASALGQETPTTNTHVLAPPRSDSGASSSESGAGSNSRSFELPASSSHSVSFAHVVRLIRTGEPIPGIREIPDTVLEGHGSQSTAPRRKKPWERGELLGGGGSSANAAANPETSATTPHGELS